jgi:hypothetical protein
MAKTMRTLLTLAVIAALLCAATPAAAEGDPRTIVLHVDDHARVAPAEELAAAEAEATRIYAAAGVSVIWERGTFDPYARLDDATHLTVVICRDASEGLDSTVAGRAARGTGRAYIFYPRIAFAALRRFRQVGTVLGMVIAHEVGHLLLPKDSHSSVGIMRADLELTSRLPPKFTLRQGAAIRASLSRGRTHGPVAESSAPPPR